MPRLAPLLVTATLLVTAATLVAACQSAGPTATGSPLVSQNKSSQTPAPIVTLGPPPSPTPPDQTSPVVLDPTVIGILPADVNGIPVKEDVNEAAQALNDPALPKIATSMDAGVAVDVANGNLVYAWVVRLRPKTFTDDFYRQWRDSYDEGACSGSSGIVGRAEATIANRTVYITTCTQGLRAYHVWLKDPAILISASAVGEGKFGELLMANLRVPA